MALKTQSPASVTMDWMERMDALGEEKSIRVWITYGWGLDAAVSSVYVVQETVSWREREMSILRGWVRTDEFEVGERETSFSK